MVVPGPFWVTEPLLFSTQPNVPVTPAAGTNVSEQAFWKTKLPAKFDAPPPRVSDEQLKLMVPPPKKPPFQVVAPAPGGAM